MPGKKKDKSNLASKREKVPDRESEKPGLCAYAFVTVSKSFNSSKSVFLKVTILH